MFLNKIINNIKTIREIGFYEWVFFKYDIYKSKKGEMIGYIRKETVKAKKENIDLRELNLSKFKDDDIDYLNSISDTLLSFIGDNFYIVEIGTGCGLITLPLINKSKNLKKYDSYEPDRSLRHYLSKTFKDYKFFSNFKGNGSYLTDTKDKKVNLTFAFGVFSLIPIAQVVSYINESKRILKSNGILAFDIFDTDSLSEKLIEKFILQASRNDSRPFISRNFLIRYMNIQGFELEKELRHAHDYILFLIFKKI